MSIRSLSCIVAAVAALAPVALGGCTDLRRALGMEKVIPDEFAVVSNAPLAIPPDFSLRPPRPGAGPTQAQSPADQAKQSIFRAGDQTAALPPGAEERSPGENELLRNAGAGAAPADIRQTITREERGAPAVSASFVDKLLFWRDSNGVPPDQVLDARQEAAQLRGGPNGVKLPAELAGPPTIERRGQPRIGG